jgi:hypothetical protein
MHSIHPAKIAFRIRVEHPQASLAPCPAQVDPKPTVVRERVADPVSARSVLDDDDDAPAVVEIPHRNAAAPS